MDGTRKWTVQTRSSRTKSFQSQDEILEKEIQTTQNDFNNNASQKTQEIDAIFQEKVHEALICDEGKWDGKPYSLN